MPFLKLGDLIQNMHPYCFFWQSTSYPHFQWGWICISYHKSHGSSRPRKQAPWLLMRGRIPGPLAATIRQSVSPVLEKKHVFFRQQRLIWWFLVFFCDVLWFLAFFLWFLVISADSTMKKTCTTMRHMWWLTNEQTGIQNRWFNKSKVGIQPRKLPSGYRIVCYGNRMKPAHLVLWFTVLNMMMFLN